MTSAKTLTTLAVENHASRIVTPFERHWLAFLNLALGVVTLMPWLAPLFMHWGWSGAGRLVYMVYSFLCHQLPERSWFFFGSKISYSVQEIAAVWPDNKTLWGLRSFVGTPEMGWKLAWSDRMVSFYGGFFLFGLVYAALRSHLHRSGWRLSRRWVCVLLLPIAIDVLTHAISDLQGVGLGFRETNVWLAFMTGKALPVDFYAGNAWGSFNAQMRLATGLLASFALMFWALPRIDDALQPRAFAPESSSRENPR